MPVPQRGQAEVSSRLDGESGRLVRSGQIASCLVRKASAVTRGRRGARGMWETDRLSRRKARNDGAGVVSDVRGGAHAGREVKRPDGFVRPDLVADAQFAASLVRSHDAGMAPRSPSTGLRPRRGLIMRSRMCRPRTTGRSSTVTFAISGVNGLLTRTSWRAEPRARRLPAVLAAVDRRVPGSLRPCAVRQLTWRSGRLAPWVRAGG